MSGIKRINQIASLGVDVSLISQDNYNKLSDNISVIKIFPDNSVEYTSEYDMPTLSKRNKAVYNNILKKENIEVDDVEEIDFEKHILRLPDNSCYSFLLPSRDVLYKNLKPKEGDIEDILDIPIIDFFHSETRIINGFEYNSNPWTANIHYLGQLVQKENEELEKYSRMGKKSVETIEKKLNEKNLSLGMDIYYIPPNFRKNKYLDLKISELDFSEETSKLLECNGFQYLGDIAAHSNTLFYYDILSSDDKDDFLNKIHQKGIGVGIIKKYMPPTNK